MTWSGLYTALITPFKNDHLDVEGLEELFRLQQEGGVDGLALLGTTGEAPTLTAEEKETIVRTARAALPSMKLMVGTGTNATRTTIETTQWAADLGADAAMVIAPYYNKPSQEGLRRHFEMVADRSPIPLILYNHPGRTGVNILPETLAHLAKHPNIVGVKEASGDLAQVAQILASTNLTVLSGDDMLTLPFRALGAHGLISVTSNLLPKQMKHLVDTGDQDLFYTLLPHFQEAARENPVAIKQMMERAHLPAGAPRLPLVGEECFV